LHVLHVIDGLGLGGAERMAVDLANVTVEAGHRVSLSITRSPDTLASDLRPTVEVLRLGRKRSFDLLPFVRLVRFANREGVDIVHVHMRSSMALLLPFRATRALRVPVLFHDHYGTIEDDRSVPRWFRIGHRFIDRYVGVSPALGTWAQEAGMRRVEVIENAIDLTRFDTREVSPIRKELGLSDDIALGVMVATIRRDKGLETMLDAVAAMQQRERVHVIVAGHRGEPDYVARIEAQHAKLSRHVTLLGGRRDVPALLRAADFGLLSSHTESGPLVLVEYLYAGLPIVSTRVGDIGRRLAAANIAGFVPPREPAQLAAALDDLVALSPAERRARGAIGKQLVESWDLRHTMPRWFAAYASTIG
jgi:glycosyltransferase involved in cell wall biosynthesis